MLFPNTLKHSFLNTLLKERKDQVFKQQQKSKNHQVFPIRNSSSNSYHKKLVGHAKGKPESI